jgi:hypothetical protein
MDHKLERLIAEIVKLPTDDQRHLLDILLGGGVANQVRDSEAGYGERSSLSQSHLSMTRVTIVLPDDLAKQAQAEGLLAGTRLADLIRRALHEQRSDRLVNGVPTQRRLVRKGGRLIVEALQGEQPITDEEVRGLFEKMEW